MEVVISLPIVCLNTRGAKAFQRSEVSTLRIALITLYQDEKNEPYPDKELDGGRCKEDLCEGKKGLLCLNSFTHNSWTLPISSIDQ